MKRKDIRRKKALARYPQTHNSRRGIRTEQQWKTERSTLAHRVMIAEAR